MTTLRSKRATNSEKKAVVLQCWDLLFGNQGVTILGESAFGVDGSYYREAEAGKLRTPPQFATMLYAKEVFASVFQLTTVIT